MAKVGQTRHMAAVLPNGEWEIMIIAEGVQFRELTMQEITDVINGDSIFETGKLFAEAKYFDDNEGKDILVDRL